MNLYKLRVFKSSESPEQVNNNADGYLSVLESYFGKPTISKEQYLFNNQYSFLITIEETTNGKVVGGVRVHSRDFHKPLPLEILFNERNIIHNQILDYSGQVSELWNGPSASGMSFSNLLLKFSVAVGIELGLKVLYTLSSDISRRLMTNNNFELIESYMDKSFEQKWKFDLMKVSINNFLARQDIDNQIRTIYEAKRGILEYPTNKGAIFIDYDITIPEIIAFEKNLSLINNELYIQLINNPELIKTMNWRVFETLLANILETFGYDIELMQGTKDGGIDIIAFSNNDHFGKHKYLLQAKRWNNKVGIDVVKNVLFNHEYYKASKSCLVTTSKFTRGAWHLADNYKWQLELKEYNAIQDWIKSAWQIKNNL